MEILGFSLNAGEIITKIIYVFVSLRGFEYSVIKQNFIGYLVCEYVCVCLLKTFFLKILLIMLGKQDMVLDLLLRCFIEMLDFIFCLPQILKNYKPTM